MPITRDELRASILAGTRAFTDLALGTVTPTAITPPDDAVTFAFVDEAIGGAMDLLGLARASFGAVADDDVAAVPDATVPRLRDEARLETCRLLKGRLLLFDQSSGSTKQSLSVLITQLDRMISDLEITIRAKYGPRRPSGAALAPMTSAAPVPVWGLSRDGGVAACNWSDGWPRP